MTSSLFAIVLFPVIVTSYNAQKSQTDGDECHGASGVNQCELAVQGVPIIALSQDLIGRASWKPFHYGDWVTLESDNPLCSGQYFATDTMSPRFRNRADLFFLDKRNNVNCKGTLRLSLFSPMEL